MNIIDELDRKFANHEITNELQLVTYLTSHPLQVSDIEHLKRKCMEYLEYSREIDHKNYKSALNVVDML